MQFWFPWVIAAIGAAVAILNILSRRITARMTAPEQRAAQEKSDFEMQQW